MILSLILLKHSTLTGNNAGDYYIEFQIAESEDEEGYLRISFTLSDSAVTPNVSARN